MNTSTKSILTISHQVASQQQMPEDYVDTKDERVDSFYVHRFYHTDWRDPDNTICLWTQASGGKKARLI